MFVKEKTMNPVIKMYVKQGHIKLAYALATDTKHREAIMRYCVFKTFLDGIFSEALMLFFHRGMIIFFPREDADIVFDEGVKTANAKNVFMYVCVVEFEGLSKIKFWEPQELNSYVSDLFDQDDYHTNNYHTARRLEWDTKNNEYMQFFSEEL